MGLRIATSLGARAACLLGLAAAVIEPARGDPLAAILDHRAASSSEVDRSPGCGAADPGPLGEIEIGGRTVLVVLPEPYDPDLPHALVLAFHGRTTPAGRARRYYDLERHASRPTIFVYPSGLPAAGGRFTWSEPGDLPSALRDYRLFDRIVDRMQRIACVDRRRVFAVGHSLGAWFVNSLACARGGVIRAIGTLGGSISVADCRGRTAAILLHNPDDRLVPFAFGEAVRDHVLARNGLGGEGSPVQVGGFACVRFGVPDDPNPLLWCPHDRDHTRRGRYYPHNWPAGTGALIIAFFESLPPE